MLLPEELARVPAGVTVLVRVCATEPVVLVIEGASDAVLELEGVGVAGVEAVVLAEAAREIVGVLVPVRVGVFDTPALPP